MRSLDGAANQASPLHRENLAHGLSIFPVWPTLHSRESARDSYQAAITETLAFVLAAFALLTTPGPTTTLLATSGAAAGFACSVHLVAAETAGYVLAISALALVIGPLVRASRDLDTALEPHAPRMQTPQVLRLRRDFRRARSLEGAGLEPLHPVPRGLLDRTRFLGQQADALAVLDPLDRRLLLGDGLLFRNPRHRSIPCDRHSASVLEGNISGEPREWRCASSRAQRLDLRSFPLRDLDMAVRCFSDILRPVFLAYLSPRPVTEASHGSPVPRRHRPAFRPDGRARLRLREAGRRQMSWLLIVSAVVAVVLLIYLIAALLNPEAFS